MTLSGNNDVNKHFCSLQLLSVALQHFDTSAGKVKTSKQIEEGIYKH